MLYRSTLYHTREFMPSTLNIRLPEPEAETLARYAATAHRSKSEIIREFIRSLRPPAEKAKSTRARAPR